MRRDGVARKPRGQKRGGFSFMLLWATLMMLVMTFFIVLVGMGTMKKEKTMVAVASFREALLTGGVGILWGGKKPLSFDYLIARERMKIKKKLFSSLEKALEEVKKVGWGISLVERGVVLRFPGEILFDLGKAELKPEAKELLDKIVPVLKENYLYSVWVEGHTDNLPIYTEKFPSNWELSAARAVNVVKYLERRGLEKERLFAVGYGEYRPLLPNDTPEHRAFNRRVEIGTNVF